MREIPFDLDGTTVAVGLFITSSIFTLLASFVGSLSLLHPAKLNPTHSVVTANNVAKIFLFIDFYSFNFNFEFLLTCKLQSGLDMSMMYNRKTTYSSNYT